MNPFILAATAVFSGGGDIGNLLIWLVVVCIVFGLVWWILSEIPLPPMAAKLVRIVFVLILAIWLIDLLLGFSGHPLFGR